MVLWDVSGSMVDYVDLYLAWLYAMVHVSSDVHVFPFGTHVEDITGTLREPFGTARRHLSRLQRLWAGGTKIGGALQLWINRYGPRALRGHPTVLIISDGWDVGTPEDLEHALRTLRAHDAGIYWLNPLGDTLGFEPTTRSLRAADPYLDGSLSGATASALLRLQTR